MGDERERMTRAERLLGDGARREAVDLFCAVARQLEYDGSPLEAIVVARRVLSLTTEHPRSYALARTAARRCLVRCFIAIGMYPDAMVWVRELYDPDGPHE